MPGVSIKGLNKTFGDVNAVKDVSLEIKDGSLVTLLGPSGCGKTTTLRCVAGLEDPTEGEISIGDDVVYASAAKKNMPPEKRQIGMVFQSYAIWPHMTVFDNIAFPLKIRHATKQAIKDGVNRALTTVRLEGLGSRPATDLSGGQQQRVALARALVHDPRLLLLDEPLSNLDASLREHMRVELKELQKRLKITSIYVTHDQLEAMSISDAVAVLDKGEIVSLGQPRDIYDRPTNKFVASFVGRTNFIESKIVSKGKDNCKLDSKIGLIDSQSKAEGFKQGETVLCAIKPENLHLHTKQPSSKTNVFDATVEYASFLGGYSEVIVSVGSETIRIHGKSEDLNVENGKKVILELPAHQCVIIKKSS